MWEFSAAPEAGFDAETRSGDLRGSRHHSVTSGGFQSRALASGSHRSPSWGHQYVVPHMPDCSGLLES
jgi:hypothetical protein